MEGGEEHRPLLRGYLENLNLLVSGEEECIWRKQVRVGVGNGERRI